jgi:trans-aconitate 2-methyltransferase
VWQTEYTHVMDLQAAIVDWISSTGLRPVLGALDTEGERARFLELLCKRVAESYDVRPDGKVLLTFRRILVIAYK